MQNQNAQTNKPKGFFGRGLDAFAKMKDNLTGQTQKQATKERDDLLRYLDFGDKMGIVDDKERAVHEAKIKSLESKIATNKNDGIGALQSLAGKGRDMFAKAKAIDLKDISNRAKGFGTALFLGGLNLVGNPAMAANTPTGPAHINNTVNIEAESFKIPVVNSMEDAVRLNGTVNQGMTVMMNGRKVKILGDGSKNAEAKGVDLVSSYNFATEKFRNAPAINQNTPNNIIDKSQVDPESSDTIEVLKVPVTRSNRSILDRIIKPNKTPEISIPAQIPEKTEPSDIVPVFVPKIREDTSIKIKPVQKPEIKNTNPAVPNSDKKDSVIFVPPVDTKPVNATPQIPKVDTGVFGLPSKPVQDPFVIFPTTKPINPLDTILKQKVESAPVAPTIVVPEIKIEKPARPVEIEKKPETKVVTPPTVNPNPNIPFVKPPLPPKPDLENYKPAKPIIETTPDTTAPQVTTPADNVRERLDIIRSGDIKPGEFFQRGEVTDAQSKLDGVNAGRPRSMPTPDRRQGVMGGVRENGKEFFVQGNLELNFGEPPSEAVSRSTRAQNLKKFIAETEKLNAQMAAELKKEKTDNLTRAVQTIPVTIVAPAIKPVDTSTAIK